MVLTRRLWYVASALFAIMLLSSCGKSNGWAVLTDEKLCEAVCHKDSAIAFYAKVDSTANFSDDERLRYGVLRLAYYYHNNHAPETDSLVMAVEQGFDKASPLMHATALISAGYAYEKLVEDDKALPCYVKAADLLKGSDNYRLLSIAYVRWGWLLKVEPPYTDGLAKVTKAESYADKLNDDKWMSQVLGIKAWCYTFAFDFNSSQRTFDKAIALANKSHADNIGWLIKGKASTYEMAGDHKRTLQYLEKAIVANKTMDKALLSMKGRCFIFLGQLDSARIYVDSARMDKRYYEKATYYDELSMIAERSGRLKEAIEYRRRFEACVDSQYDEDRKLALAQSERRYNYTLVQTERDHYALDSQRKTALSIALMAVLVAVGIGALYIHQRYRRRTKDALRMKDDLLAQSLALVKERGLQLMQTKQEAQDKEMELLTSLNDKDEQLIELRQQQRGLKESILHTNDVIRKIENIRRMNEAKKIASAKSIALSADEMQNLIDSTNLCYDNFVERLRQRFGELTPGDLCLCCLLKLGVGSQDQSLLLNTTDSTLRTRKYRLKKKKMQLDDDYGTLDDFMRTF